MIFWFGLEVGLVSSAKLCDECRSMFWFYSFNFTNK